MGNSYIEAYDVSKDGLVAAVAVVSDDREFFEINSEEASVFRGIGIISMKTYTFSKKFGIKTNQDFEKLSASAIAIDKDQDLLAALYT